MSHADTKPRKQVAAIPVLQDEAGEIRVCLISSRSGERFIVPKGKAEPSLKDYRAAEVEADEEAGLLGHAVKKSIGRYRYWKRVGDHFELCQVKVFMMKVDAQRQAWKEQGQRRGAWLPLKDAIALVDEPLIPFLEALPKQLERRPNH